MNLTVKQIMPYIQEMAGAGAIDSVDPQAVQEAIRAKGADASIEDIQTARALLIKQACLRNERAGGRAKNALALNRSARPVPLAKAANAKGTAFSLMVDSKRSTPKLELVKTGDAEKKPNLKPLYRAFDAPIPEKPRKAAERVLLALREAAIPVTDGNIDKLEDQRKKGSNTLGGFPLGKDEDVTHWQQATKDTATAAREIGLKATPDQLEKLMIGLNKKMLTTNKGGLLRSSDRGGGLFPSSELKNAFPQFAARLSDRLQAIDKGEANPVEVAAQTYVELNSIHPFWNANGRVCQMMMDYVLMSAGLPPPALGGMNIAHIATTDSEEEGKQRMARAVAQVTVGLENSLSILQKGQPLETGRGNVPAKRLQKRADTYAK